jgi:hypothetical protein
MAVSLSTISEYALRRPAGPLVSTVTYSSAGDFFLPVSRFALRFYIPLDAWMQTKFQFSIKKISLKRFSYQFKNR